MISAVVNIENEQTNNSNDIIKNKYTNKATQSEINIVIDNLVLNINKSKEVRSKLNSLLNKDFIFYKRQ